MRAAGGWDPYNVTEDADLGMRLARFGYRVGVIDSTTYEEAPAHIGPWLRQRTRWFKGWMRLVNKTKNINVQNKIAVIVEKLTVLSQHCRNKRDLAELQAARRSAAVT